MGTVLISFESANDATTFTIHRPSTDLVRQVGAGSALTELKLAHDSGLPHIESKLGELVLIAIAYSNDAPALRELLKGRVHDVMGIAVSRFSDESKNPENLFKLGLLLAAQGVSTQSVESVEKADALIREAAAKGFAEAQSFLTQWPSVKAEYIKLCGKPP